MTSTDCVFCSLPDGRIWIDDETTIAFRDNYPISPGHTLVIPRRHVVSAFRLPPVELAQLWHRVREVRERLHEEFHPDGFNVGLNDGAAAGQTVMHAHVHVIPRYRGDVPDARGGIRGIISGKAAYWKQ